MISLKHIPNILSVSRLVASTSALYFAFADEEKIFSILVVYSLLTDLLDGIIARKFNWQTKFGAQLDSLADMVTFFVAVVGLYFFKFDDFAPRPWPLLTLMAFYILAYVIPFIKFRTFASLHLLSGKITAYMLGFFFFILFTFGFYPILYYICTGWGIAGFIESITIHLLSDRPLSNARGLYWILKDKQLTKKNKTTR